MLPYLYKNTANLVYELDNTLRTIAEMFVPAALTPKFMSNPRTCISRLAGSYPTILVTDENGLTQSILSPLVSKSGDLYIRHLPALASLLYCVSRYSTAGFSLGLLVDGLAAYNTMRCVSTIIASAPSQDKISKSKASFLSWNGYEEKGYIPGAVALAYGLYKFYTIGASFNTFAQMALLFSAGKSLFNCLEVKNNTMYTELAGAAACAFSFYTGSIDKASVVGATNMVVNNIISPVVSAAVGLVR